MCSLISLREANGFKYELESIEQKLAECIVNKSLLSSLTDLKYNGTSVAGKKKFDKIFKNHFYNLTQNLECDMESIEYDIKDIQTKIKIMYIPCLAEIRKLNKTDIISRLDKLPMEMVDLIGSFSPEVEEQKIIVKMLPKTKFIYDNWDRIDSILNSVPKEKLVNLWIATTGNSRGDKGKGESNYNINQKRDIIGYIKYALGFQKYLFSIKNNSRYRVTLDEISNAKWLKDRWYGMEINYLGKSVRGSEFTTEQCYSFMKGIELQNKLVWNPIKKTKKSKKA